MLLQRSTGAVLADETTRNTQAEEQSATATADRSSLHHAEVSASMAQGATLPSAKSLQSLAQSARAARRLRPNDELAQRRALIEEQRDAFLAAPLPADTLARLTAQVSRAATEGELAAHVYRFPSEYCTDRGRALNNEDHEWPATLQGLALAHYNILLCEFVPLGFHIGAQIVTWPMLMPGDASLILSWRT
ncbi:MAG: hypothetical protein B7Z36_02305 [Novosphingobium sp. 12-63-9]|nr:MAG: hypothetical protein B7Z36_02305 [Novosphingobium sp. 12-63-9]